MTDWTGMYFGLTTLYPAMNLPYRYRYGPHFDLSGKIAAALVTFYRNGRPHLI